jgi:hypothetical protein
MQKHKDDALVLGRLALAKAEWAEWVAEHGRMVLIGSACFLAILFISYQLISKFGSRGRSDFASADLTYSQWVAKESFDPVLFKQLQKPLSTYPELHQKFGALVAQQLLNCNEAERARPFASAVWKRTEGTSAAFYSQFSKGSLLIGEGKVQEALEGAKSLKESMEQDLAFWTSQDPLVRSGSLLYAFNLLRIAVLEREGGSPMGELLAWQELLKKAGWNGVPADTPTYDAEAYAALLRHFQEQDVSLLDYIYNRLHYLLP